VITASGLGYTAQTQLDLNRMSQQLSELQREIGQGTIADDLKGYGGTASQLLNAQSLKAAAVAKTSVIAQLQARFDVQGASLQQVADGARALAQSIRTAISANDGRGISTDLELDFSSIVSALNQTWNGQPLFGGERQGAGPIKINSLQQLVAATGPSDLFDEAAREQTIQLGAGTPIVLAKKASDLSQGLFDSMKSLQQLLNISGGEIGQPISPADQATLQQIASQLDTQAASFDTESGRAGQLQTRLETQSSQLQAQSDLLTKEIGDERDADIAQVSIQLNLLQTQYQASAKTFVDLSKLSLLNYL
jgi:flagellar hook-associated protein 3 FlgL